MASPPMAAGTELGKLARAMLQETRAKKAAEQAKSAAAAEKPMAISTHFFVMCTGQIEFGQFNGADNLYCRYAFSFGNDWAIVHGMDTGLTQIARKGGGADTSTVWNFPVDITFKSTNAFGWPRLAISVYGVDGWGRDVVVGYGSLLVPTVPGPCDRLVHMFAPQASSMLQHMRSWLAGAYPEFFDSKFVTRGEGREVTRVKRTGVVKVSLNVMTRGMASFGYNGTEPTMLLRPGLEVPTSAPAAATDVPPGMAKA